MSRTTEASRRLSALRHGRSDARWIRQVGPWAAVGVVAATIGVALAISPLIGLAVAGATLAFGVFVVDPVLFAVIVLPGALLIQRVGGSSTNLSAADVLCFGGGIVSLVLVRWSEAAHLKHFLRGIVWFQAVLILVVIAHPFRGDIVEWFHRWSYLALATIVGWVVATSGRARQTFRLYLWGSTFLGFLAIATALTHHLQPAQWGLYQKNAIGAAMWVAIVIAQINPPWARIDLWESRVVRVVCLFGLLAAQSRQSAILLALAVGTALLLDPDSRRKAKLAVIVAIPLVGLVYYSFVTAAHNNPKFNSVSIRYGQIDAALHVWHLSPVLGMGMRFYNLPQYISVTAPPNSIIDNLASTGIVGSVAFFVLVGMTLLALWRLPRVYGTLGFVVLLAHYVDGLFDTFWIGSLCIPAMVIAGISLGMADADPDLRWAPEGRPRDLTRVRTPAINRRRVDQQSDPLRANR